MLSFQNDNLMTFLTDEEIRKRCPLAYVNTPTNPNVSEQYVQANTATVIADMKKLGWGVVEAKQRKPQKNSRGIFSYHMICFQNPKIKITKPDENGEEVIDCFPRIILTNSHDGQNAFKFMIGLFRLVCSNGLVIASERFADIKIRHIHYNFEELRMLIAKAVEELPNQVAVMNKMKEVALSNDQKLALALSMLKIRKDLKDTDKLNVDETTLEDMLMPIRHEDKGDDLWSVFNVLQEKIIKGGFKTAEEGKKPRKMRRVTSFVKDLDYNQKMFETALTYLPTQIAA